jgi:hypothetical protein
MCLWAVRHVQFEKMSGKQKADLRKKLQARKKAVQAQMSDVNKALKHVAKKSKG